MNKTNVNQLHQLKKISFEHTNKLETSQNHNFFNINHQ